MAENRDMHPEADIDYEKASSDLLKAGLKRSFTERFHMMTTLMKMNLMFKQADIRHKPFPAEKK